MDKIDVHFKAQFPSALSWSPDGQRLAYQVSGPAGCALRVYSFREASDRCLDDAIPPFRLYKDKPDIRWAEDGRVIYNAGVEYRIAGPSHADPQLYGSVSLLGDLAQLSPDTQWFSFIRGGDLWVQPTAGGTPQQLTRREGLLDYDGQLFGRLAQWPVWSPDSRSIAYLSPMAYGWKARIVSISDGAIRQIVPAEDLWAFTILNWSPDGQKLAVSRLSQDFQRKDLSVYDLASGEEQLLHSDRDERWVDHNIHPGFDVTWSPDSRSIAYLSNQSGWRHLYLADIRQGSCRQITQGPYDCYWCDWSPDGQKLALVTSQGDLQQRGLWVYSMVDGSSRRVTRQPGVCLGGWYLRQMNLAWSPDGETIAHVFSGPDSLPALRASDTRGEADPVVIYDSRPAELPPQEVMHLEPARFAGADGRELYGVLATLPGLDRTRKHPALVFTYGAWDQEAQLGWDFFPKNLIFNYLTGQGYVILLVDPRGSDGYGADYAHAQYHEGGRKQADDVVSAAHYLASLGFVDPQHIALYGYSYGGYMVLQTMVHSPGTFAAGISQAPVSEWAAYAGYTTYTSIRFGSPDEAPNPLLVRSPVYQAYKIESPLLIVHGAQDFNVPLASSEFMVRALLQTGKTFEYMVYPDEGHVWVKPETIRDFLARISRFLKTYLTTPEEA